MKNTKHIISATAEFNKQGCFVLRTHENKANGTTHYSEPCLNSQLDVIFNLSELETSIPFQMLPKLTNGNLSLI